MKYKIDLHWKKTLIDGGGVKFPPREGELKYPDELTCPAEALTGRILNRVLERIFELEQNEVTPRDVPSASVGDVIELEDGRRFIIENEGFSLENKMLT